MDTRNDLQETLGTAYIVDRELGGGGMSRVFLAEERALGRRVVLKMLPADVAGGVSAERFAREIRLAANLQHPCIVPVLSAGDARGVPYYTMPFVDGDCLRVRMAREAVPLGEALKILRDVASAMLYAHEHGTVHRDIKPDNILLSRGYAVVADFGIAKAIEGAKTMESLPGSTLTQTGTAIGTPAYMAPEQAAGDPDTDHRADLYAWGLVAHELLGGAHPFAGRTSAQALLAAQMGERPSDLAAKRRDLPTSISALVMQCVEKDPALRPQSASEIIAVLDAATTPSAPWTASRPTVTGGSSRTLATALAVYVVAFGIAAILARGAIVGIGLPSWVLPGVVIVMALGFPVVLFTAYAQRAAFRGAGAPRVTPGGGTATLSRMEAYAAKASPHVSWRRAALGGTWAIVAFVVIVAGYMALRALGIGPAGSLLAAGVINKRDQLLVADFSMPSGDSALARAVAEAIRTDLAGSDVVSLVPGSVVRQTLTLMEKPATTPIDTVVAREIAQRAGVKAVLGGDITAIGTSYRLTARLISPKSGDLLAAFRENATDQGDLLPAVERLSRSLRAKLGESLHRIQGEQALTDVTTQSLDALRLYAQAIHVGDDLGDIPRGFDLMQQAVQKDSTFAMAWRKLGSWSNNRGDGRAEIYAKKAVDNAAHLSTHERYNAIASLHMTAGAAYDPVAAIGALTQAIEIDSLSSLGMGNLAIQESTVGRLDSAIVYGRRAAALGSAYGMYHLALFYLEEGRIALGDSAMEEAHRRAPGFAYRPTFDVMWYHVRGHYDSAASVAKSRNLPGLLAAEQVTQGQLRSASSTLLALADENGKQGQIGPALDAVASESWIESTMRGRPAVALSQLVDAEQKYPVDREPLPHRPYYQLAAAYAMAGNTTRAHELIRDGDRLLVDGLARWNASEAVIAKGMVALAEKRPRDAVAVLENPPFCGGTTPRNSSVAVRVRCALPFLALAYDRAGNADSARAVFQRYVDDTFTARFVTDEFMLAESRQRLGELLEAKGDRAAARKYYSLLLMQWKNADPELAPRVADITRRVARLSDPEHR